MSGDHASVQLWTFRQDTKVPSGMVCRLSWRIIVDPVVDPDDEKGRAVERAAFEYHQNRYGVRPETGLPSLQGELRTHGTLSKFITQFMKDHRLWDKGTRPVDRDVQQPFIAANSCEVILHLKKKCKEIDASLFCPLSLRLMDEPVFARNNPSISFQRSAIEAYIELYGNHPQTGERLKVSDLRPDSNLADIVRNWIHENTKFHRTVVAQRPVGVAASTVEGGSGGGGGSTAFAPIRALQEASPCMVLELVRDQPPVAVAARAAPLPPALARGGRAPEAAPPGAAGHDSMLNVTPQPASAHVEGPGVTEAGMAVAAGITAKTATAVPVADVSVTVAATPAADGGGDGKDGGGATAAARATHKRPLEPESAERLMARETVEEGPPKRVRQECGTICIKVCPDEMEVTIGAASTSQDQTGGGTSTTVAITRSDAAGMLAGGATAVAAGALGTMTATATPAPSTPAAAAAPSTPATAAAPSTPAAAAALVTPATAAVPSTPAAIPPPTRPSAHLTVAPGPEIAGFRKDTTGAGAGPSAALRDAPAGASGDAAPPSPPLPMPPRVQGVMAMSALAMGLEAEGVVLPPAAERPSVAAATADAMASQEVKVNVVDLTNDDEEVTGAGVSGPPRTAAAVRTKQEPREESKETYTQGSDTSDIAAREAIEIARLVSAIEKILKAGGPSAAGTPAAGVTAAGGPSAAAARDDSGAAGGGAAEQAAGAGASGANACAVGGPGSPADDGVAGDAAPGSSGGKGEGAGGSNAATNRLYARWSTEERLALAAAVKVYGMKWAQIKEKSPALSARSTYAIEQKWAQMCWDAGVAKSRGKRTREESSKSNVEDAAAEDAAAAVAPRSTYSYYSREEVAALVDAVSMFGDKNWRQVRESRQELRGREEMSLKAKWEKLRAAAADASKSNQSPESRAVRDNIDKIVQAYAKTSSGDTSWSGPGLGYLNYSLEEVRAVVEGVEAHGEDFHAILRSRPELRRRGEVSLENKWNGLQAAAARSWSKCYHVPPEDVRMKIATVMEKEDAAQLGAIVQEDTWLYVPRKLGNRIFDIGDQCDFKVQVVIDGAQTPGAFQASLSRIVKNGKYRLTQCAAVRKAICGKKLLAWELGSNGGLVLKAASPDREAA